MQGIFWREVVGKEMAQRTEVKKIAIVKRLK